MFAKSLPAKATDPLQQKNKTLTQRRHMFTGPDRLEAYKRYLHREQ